MMDKVTKHMNYTKAELIAFLFDCQDRKESLQTQLERVTKKSPENPWCLDCEFKDCEVSTDDTCAYIRDYHEVKAQLEEIKAENRNLKAAAQIAVDAGEEKENFLSEMSAILKLMVDKDEDAGAMAIDILEKYRELLKGDKK